MCDQRDKIRIISINMNMNMNMNMKENILCLRFEEAV